MYENAYEVFKYLPIEQTEESVYIQHLWGSFELLNKSDEPVKAFSLLPFHLLFMFAVQYKVYRLSAYDNAKYIQILSRCYANAGNRKQLEINAPIRNNDGIILSECSVKNLSLIKEKELFDFLEIIDCDRLIIDKAKLLVESRGNYAHANGQIEEDVNTRIDEYLEILQHIQGKISGINNQIFELDENIQEFDDIEEYIVETFRDNQFSQKDFGSVIQKILESELLTFEQWEQFIQKGLDNCYEETIQALEYISRNNQDESKMFNARQKLETLL